jgi:prepilin-type N-terminal cleavage/methylation domain-containing protein
VILRPAACRRGFTLLEVLLASAIGIMLLGGLYVAFDITLRQTDVGREAVERGDLARAIVNKMGIDFAGSLGPLQPKSGGGLPSDSSSSSSGSGSGGLNTGTLNTGSVNTGGVNTGSLNSGSTAGGSGGSSSGSDSSSSTPAEATGAVAADVPFQAGVFGTDKQITLYVSRVPPALAVPDLTGSGQVDPRPDLRRVTYYLGAGGGLCRQERPWVTADGVRNSTDPDPGEEANDLISDEVTDVVFEYFDGGGWVNTWSGSDTATDGQTPLGPPRAVRVTLTVQPASGGTTRQVQHVFPIRAAVGLYLPPVDSGTTQSGSSTGTSSTSGM